MGLGFRVGVGFRVGLGFMVYVSGPAMKSMYAYKFAQLNCLLTCTGGLVSRS